MTDYQAKKLTLKRLKPFPDPISMESVLRSASSFQSMMETMHDFSLKFFQGVGIPSEFLLKDEKSTAAEVRRTLQVTYGFAFSGGPRLSPLVSTS